MNKKTHPNVPAHPVHISQGNAGIRHDGLTKREHFAAMAMQGILANSLIYEAMIPASKHYGVSSSQGTAEFAVTVADALIAELNKGGEADE